MNTDKRVIRNINSQCLLLIHKLHMEHDFCSPESAFLLTYLTLRQWLTPFNKRGTGRRWLATLELQCDFVTFRFEAKNPPTTF